MIKLYADCRTDMERASFFRSGTAWESGIVAKSLEGDLADAFAFRATVAAALAELRAEMDELLLRQRHGTPAEALMSATRKVDATIVALGLEAAK